MCRLPRVEELLLSLQLGLLTRQIFMVPIRYSGPRRPPETGAHSLATGPADRGLGSVGGLGALPWCSLGNSAAHYHPQTPLPLPGPSSPCSHTGCSLVFDHAFRAWSETFFSSQPLTPPPSEGGSIIFLDPAGIFDCHPQCPTIYEAVWILSLF